MDNLMKQTDNLDSIHKEWPDFDLDNYAKRVTDKYKVLDFSALITSSKDDINDTDILLQDVFVPQTVEKTAYKFQDNLVQTKSKSVLKVIAKQGIKHLILLGDAGSGKSTLVQYLLLSLLNNKISQDFEAFAGHLPLLIELGHYFNLVTLGKCNSFIEYLSKQEEYGLHNLELKELLQTRKSLIIFDGLDEIYESEKRNNMTENIVNFAEKYPKAKIIITSRIFGYQDMVLRNTREYILQDLGTEQIKIVVRNWFNLISKNQEEANLNYRQIETELENSPKIKKLAGNPLLLTMVIAKHHDLPIKKTEFYDHVVKYYWDMVSKHFNFEEDELELLRKIAWQMQTKNLQSNFILGEDLYSEIAIYLKNHQELNKIEIIAHEIISKLQNSILRKYEDNLYGFVHQTFLEYCCAVEIVYQFEKTISFEQLKSEYFLANFRDTAWQEVLRFVCRMIEPSIVIQIVEFLLPNIRIKDDEEKFLNRINISPDIFYLRVDNLLEEWESIQIFLNETNQTLDSVYLTQVATNKLK